MFRQAGGIDLNMNLQSWTNNVARKEKSGAKEGFFRQIRRDSLFLTRHFMSVIVRAIGVAVSLVSVLVAVGLPASAQTNYYATNGIEYSIAGSLPGDQMFSDVALSSTSGIVVWEDNVTDGNGWGISAQRLDTTLSGVSGPFRVNATGAGDQEKPKVAMLKNGGAIFVWQGGTEGYQHVYARYLTPTGTFLTSTDLLVSTYSNSNSFQIDPSVAVLNNSNVVVVWSSFNQAGNGSMLDIYAKILSPNGATVVSEFLVNQFTNYNQRTPAISALGGGGFAVSWVSEQQQVRAASLENNTTYYTNNTSYRLMPSLSVPSVNIYARLYQGNGVAMGAEFQVDSGNGPSANPRVASASDGGFLIVWSGLDTFGTNAWDIYGRSFSAPDVGGLSVGASPVRLNSYLFQNQYAPRLCSIGLDYLVAWTSLGQDGSREGVFGRFVHSGGSPVGLEFQINTTVAGQQMQPAVASDGTGQFLAVWSGYTASPSSFDLFAQRYKNVAALLLPMSAPYVWVPFNLSNNIYQPQLVVAWPPVLGLSVSNYQIFVDGSLAPLAIVTTNTWTMTAANGLTANSTHAFQVGYVTASGSQSKPSAATSATTWSGQSWGPIPWEWMQQYYGSNPSIYTNYQVVQVWPSPVSGLGSGGMSLFQVFLSGGNPLDSSTWLQQKITNTPEGAFLTWNTQAGAVYQVQVTTDLKTWSNLGAARFAAGNSDSIYVGGSATGYYRVLLLR